MRKKFLIKYFFHLPKPHRVVVDINPSFAGDPLEANTERNEFNSTPNSSQKLLEACILFRLRFSVVYAAVEPKTKNLLNRLKKKKNPDYILQKACVWEKLSISRRTPQPPQKGSVSKLWWAPKKQTKPNFSCDFSLLLGGAFEFRTQESTSYILLLEEFCW